MATAAKDTGDSGSNRKPTGRKVALITGIAGQVNGSYFFLDHDYNDFHLGWILPCRIAFEQRLRSKFCQN